jgi:ABC-2 type transport system permease protein
VSEPANAIAGGTVFDIGYRRYEGERLGRTAGRRAVYVDGLRAALGIGRGGRAKILPWAFLGLLASIALIMALVAGAAERLVGPGATERLNLPGHGDFNAFASVILYAFAALVAPELLCRDKRDGTLSLYLVRPITGTDYIVGRWTAFLTIMLAAALAPQAILFLGLSLGHPAPLDYLATHWLDPLRVAAAGLAMATYLTSFAMLVASFTSRRAYASVVLVGLFAITTPFTAGVSQEIEGAAGQWIAMFNLTNIPLHVNDAIFGTPTGLTEESPAVNLPKAIHVAWWALWTGLTSLLLWRRYRRVAP